MQQLLYFYKKVKQFLLLFLATVTLTVLQAQPILTNNLQNNWVSIKNDLKHLTKGVVSNFENEISINETNFKEKHQLQLTIQNNKNVEDSFYFFLGHWLQFDLQKKQESKWVDAEVQQLFLPILLQKHPFGLLKLKPGETATYIITPKVRNFNYGYFKPYLIKPNELANFGFHYYYESHKVFLLITLLFLGFMIAAFIYALMSYLLQKTREHLSYGIYALFFILYFGSRLFFLSVTDYYILQHASYLIHFLQIFGYVFYGLFIISLLKLHKKKNLLYRLLVVFATIAIIYVIVDAILIYQFNTIKLSMKLYAIMRIVLLIVSGLTILILYKTKDKLSNYVAAGVFALFLFSLISLWSSNTSTSLKHPVYNTFFDLRITLYQIGITIELVLFTIALQYKIMQNNRERVLENEKLRLENEQKEMQSFMAVMKAKDNERTRIAQEIHDDIGSGLTNIRLLSEIAKAKSNSLPNENIALQKISNSANELIENMNEIIWSINSKNDSLHNLIAYLRSYVVKYFEDYESYTVQIDIKNNIPNINIDGSFRRSIFLVIKEALHNIVKHAKANKVSFQILYLDPNNLNIVIEDNGIGIVEGKNLQFSNGIRNMQERIKSLGGNVIVYSKKGVIIHIQMPLSTT